jgi:hypothetical protein
VSDTPVAGLLDLLDEAYDRRSWHGTNLRGALRRIEPSQVTWRPGPDRHNVWELAVHAAYWKYTVWRRITGAAKRGSFPLDGSNFFPRVDPFDADLWAGDLALLADQHRRLRAAVAALTPRDLSRNLGGRPLVWMVRGAAAHDLYHAGQIQLLKTLAPRARRRTGQKGAAR